MQLIHLPPSLVPYLNGLVHPEADLATDRTDVEITLAFMRAWWEFERSYSVDDREAGQLENLGHLLDQVPAMLDLDDRKAQREALVPALYQIVGFMESIRLHRERAEYSQQPPVNDLILAGVACLQGRGELRAVLERLDRIHEYYQNLRQALRGNQARLRPEVVEQLKKGLEHVKAAIDQLEEAVEQSDMALLEEGLAMLKEGSEITQHLIDWHRRDTERITERYQRFLIPEAGPMLQMSLEAAREFPKEQWERGIRGVREQTLPDLVRYWRDGQIKVILPFEQRAECLDRIDAGLAGVEAALDVMEDPEKTAEEGLEAFEAALVELSGAFQAVRDSAPDPSHLQGSQAGDYFELAMGLLRGTVPLLAIPEMLHASPPPDSSWEPIVEPLLRYGMAEEGEHLYESMLAILEKFPAPHEEAAPDSWACPYCGHPNALSVRQCGSCNSSAGQLEAASWSA